MSYATEDDIFAVLPTEQKRPKDVVVDGKGGITQPTMDMFIRRYQRSIDAELSKAGLPIPEAPYDELLVGAHAHMVAGAYMRKFTSMQGLYTDAYATANIFLRQYIADRQITLGVNLGSPAFVIDTDELPSTTTDGFPDL